MDIIFNHSLVSAHDTINFKSFKNSGADHCSYAGIHAGSVTTRSKYTYLADIFIHSNWIGNCFQQLNR